MKFKNMLWLMAIILIFGINVQGFEMNSKCENIVYLK